MKKLVFNFNSKDTKKIILPKNILGGKGASLAEMDKLGLPVPLGFTISTEACELFYKNNKKLNSYIIKQIKKRNFNYRKKIGKKIWKFKKSIISIGKIWCKSFNAWNDGYYIELGFK